MNQFQILAVVVLHEKQLAESETLSSLEQALAKDDALAGQIRILLWDNSAQPKGESPLALPFEYRHSGENTGLSGAYNKAAALALEAGIPWLLLLDQDSKLPLDFLHDMLQHAAQQLPQKDVAAIVPTVYVRDFIVSPRRMLFNRHVPYPQEEPCPAYGEPAAINSGTILRVDHLLEIGGFSEAFWLDYSDWYVFHQLFLRGKHVWRATNIHLQHSMTVMDYDNLMSLSRYKNYLAAEGAFNDLYKGGIENAVQTLRLVARVIRQRKRLKNREFSRITLNYFLKRLLSSRKKRIQWWNRESGPPRKIPG